MSKGGVINSLDQSKLGFFLPHHAYTPMQFTPTYTPLLYGKTGVYRGIHLFLIFIAPL